MERIDRPEGPGLAVHDLGGSGPPLVLAHATGFHGRVFTPLVRRLTQRAGLHCWAPDLRGHGSSDRMDDLDYHWDGFADDVLAVIDVLAERQPGEAIVGFGHSKGGAALLLAEQRRPGTFRALYLYEPVVFPFVPEFVGDHPLSVGAERRRPGFGSNEEAIENYSSKAPLDVLHPEALRAYVEHGFEPSPDGGVTLRCLPAHEAQVYRMGVAHDAFAHLGEVGCPVVVARGNVAEPGPASVAAAIAEALPHGTLHALDDLGHFGPLQDPERIADDAAEVLAPS